MSSMRGLVLFVLLCGGLVIGGCSATLAPINNVTDKSVVSASSSAGFTLEQVRGALVTALAAKGWHVEAESPGALTARVSSGGHWATIDVMYSASSYSIKYRESSPGLKSDGTRIHRRYNHWVRLLDERINAELVAAAGPAPAAPAAPAAPPAAPPAPPAAPAAPAQAAP